MRQSAKLDKRYHALFNDNLFLMEKARSFDAVQAEKESLERKNCVLEKQVAALQKLNAKLAAENQALSEKASRTQLLEKKLQRAQKTNSQTSSLPPSSDICSRTPEQVDETVPAQEQKEAENPKRTPTSSRKPSDKDKRRESHPLRAAALASDPDEVINKYGSKIPAGAVPVYDPVNPGRLLYHAAQEVSLKSVPFITETRFYPASEGEKTIRQIWKNSKFTLFGILIS